MTSRTDAIDIGWAELGDDDGQQRRQTGMEGHEPEHFEPGALAAALPPRDGAAGTPPSTAGWDDLAERPEWHAAATPPAVAGAWRAVEEAVEAAVDAERDERALGGQEAAAQRVESARVRAAVAAGKSVKASPGRDWSAERRHLGAIAAGRRDQARRLRGEYDELVLEHRDAWAARIIEDLPSAKAQALKVLAEASAAVEQLVTAASAAQAMQLERGGSVVALPSVRQCVEAARSLADEIEASDQLAGIDLCRPPMTPSWYERQQISASIRAGVVDSAGFWLAEVERRENYKLTAWTRGIPLGERPSEATSW